MLEKPKLFLNFKEFLVVFFIFLILFSIRFGFLYKEYREFVSKPFYYTWVEVLLSYQKKKKNRTYTVLKVYSPTLDLKFFTTSYKFNDFTNKRVRLKLFPTKRITFFDYLSTAYIPSEINSISDKKKSIESLISEKIAQQHKNKIITEFYQAIFLAKPISKELREKISKWGISHLLALSGFHLAILSGILFLIFKPLYKLLQQRFFPYRFELIDIGFITLVFLGFYVWLVGSPASLIRSFAMMVIGWIVIIFGIELVSFEFLLTAIMFILLLFPKMIVSLSFWFSVFGVFYIFLLIREIKLKNKFLMTFVVSFGIFILMLPIVHIIFPLYTPFQLFSPFLSVLFSLFYPLVILLHILGVGGIFDEVLIDFFKLPSNSIDIKTPLYFGVFYILLSIGAIFSKKLFYILLSIAFLFLVYIILLSLNL